MQHYKYESVGIAPVRDSKSAIKTRNMDDFTGWKQVGNFSSYDIFAKGELRRLVDIATGRIIIEYSFRAVNSNAKDQV